MTADTTWEGEPREQPAGCDLLTPMSHSVCLLCASRPAAPHKGWEALQLLPWNCRCRLQGWWRLKGGGPEQPSTTVILRAHAYSYCFNSEVHSWKALLLSNKQSLTMYFFQPSWVVQLIRMPSSHTQKGCGFHPWSGCEWRQRIDVCLLLSQNQ